MTDATAVSDLKEPLSLDDIALFLAVAQAGGLAGAAAATGSSVPTLSRRMTRLERQMGRRLFLRGSRGYALSPDGRALADEAGALGALKRRIESFGGECVAAPWVRITAGLWTARFLARNVRRFWSDAAPFVPKLVGSNLRVDIARREADIGIRNRRPDQDWLAGRRIGWVDYAEFATDPALDHYIALPEELAETPSQRWLRRERGDAIVTEASDSRLMLDLALSGMGRIVLPIFAAADLPDLQQVSSPIAELRSEEWLVSHHDGRHEPPVRAALDAIDALLSDPGRPGTGR